MRRTASAGEIGDEQRQSRKKPCRFRGKHSHDQMAGTVIAGGGKSWVGPLSIDHRRVLLLYHFDRQQSTF